VDINNKIGFDEMINVDESYDWLYKIDAEYPRDADLIKNAMN
jgi:hypothetical protein